MLTRPTFLRGFHNYLHYNRVHRVDFVIAVACFLGLILTLAWPRPPATLDEVSKCTVTLIHEGYRTTFSGVRDPQGACLVSRKRAL